MSYVNWRDHIFLLFEEPGQFPLGLWKIKLLLTFGILRKNIPLQGTAHQLPVQYQMSQESSPTLYFVTFLVWAYTN